MEGHITIPIDSDWSIGNTMLEIRITQITSIDTHILEKLDNFSTTVYKDLIVLSDSPQLFGIAPSHTLTLNTQIS